MLSFNRLNAQSPKHEEHETDGGGGVLAWTFWAAKLWAEVAGFPFYLSFKIWWTIASTCYEFFRAAVIPVLNFEQQAHQLLENAQHHLESGRRPPPSEPHQYQELGPPHSLVSGHEPLPFSPAPIRRPRPASYHGIGHVSSTISTVPSPTLTTFHHRTRSGGIKALELPIKVASAQSSPRFNGDTSLPQLDEEDADDGPHQRPFLSRNNSFRRNGTRAQTPLSTGGRSGRVSFAIDDITHTPTPLESTALSQLVHQSEANDNFAQHERDSLLFRIAELENALMEQNQKAALIIDEERRGETVATNDESDLSHLMNESPYPSPPGSPRLQESHETHVLENGNNARLRAHPEHPTVLLTSPTLLLDMHSESERGGAEGRL